MPEFAIDESSGGDVPFFGQPSPKELPSFKGYEEVAGFGQEFTLTPPTQNYKISQSEPETINFENESKVSEKECKQLLFEFASEHTCYGKGFIEKIDFEKILNTSALHVCFSFCIVLDQHT